MSIKKFIINIKKNYIKDTKIFVSLLLLISAVFLNYRLNIFRLILTIYKDFSPLTFSDYLMSSWHYDSAMILLVSGIIYIILTILYNYRVWKYIVSIVSILFLAVFSLMFVEFFKLYETSFQGHVLSKEIAAGWREIIISIVAEIPLGLYLKFFLILFFLILLFYFLYFYEKKNFFSKPAIILQFILIIFFISIFWASNPGEALQQASAKLNKIPEKKRVRLLKEFSVNPFFDLIFSSREKEMDEFEEGNGKTRQEVKAGGSFQFGLDTESMASGKRYPRINSLPRGKKYNIIFYFFESTYSKYLDIKVDGKYILSTWQKLRKNSFVANKHYAHFPLSANALFSILASAYDLPVKGIVIDNFPRIKLKTVSGFLRDQGYRTCYVHSGNLEFTGQRDYLSHRFDKIYESRDLKKITPYKKWLGWGIDDRAMIRPSIDYLKKDRTKPFFIVYSPVNPHHPYFIPEKKFNITKKINKAKNNKERNWYKYLNALHYADTVLKELIASLEKEGLMSETLLFLVADHGEAFYQHRQNYNHAFLIYEENVHVPFLIYNKKYFKKTVVYNGISRHVDILPTLLDILALPGDKRQEGISLFSAHFEQMAFVHTHWGIKDHLGLRDGKWKYILGVNDMYEELFDLTLDPGEQNNLAHKQPGLISRYRKFVLDARAYKRNFFKNIQKR